MDTIANKPDRTSLSKLEVGRGEVASRTSIALQGMRSFIVLVYCVVMMSLVGMQTAMAATTFKITWGSNTQYSFDGSLPYSDVVGGAGGITEVVNTDGFLSSQYFNGALVTAPTTGYYLYSTTLSYASNWNPTHYYSVNGGLGPVYTIANGGGGPISGTATIPNLLYLTAGSSINSAWQVCAGCAPTGYSWFYTPAMSLELLSATAANSTLSCIPTTTPVGGTSTCTVTGLSAYGTPAPGVFALTSAPGSTLSTNTCTTTSAGNTCNFTVTSATEGKYAVSAQIDATEIVNSPTSVKFSIFNYWDGDAGPFANGVVNGGNGTWENANIRWTDSIGAINGFWPAGQIAYFSGTAGTVTVSGTQDISGLDFSTPGYTLTGGVLNGVAAMNTITNHFTGASDLALLDTVLASSVGGGYSFVTAIPHSSSSQIVLTQNASYTGATEIRCDGASSNDGAILQLGNGGGAGDIANTSALIGGATCVSVLYVDRTGTVNMNYPISGKLSFWAQGTGAINLNGANSFTGSVYAYLGTVNLNASNALGIGTYAEFYAGPKINLAPNVAQTFDSFIANDAGTVVSLASGSSISYQLGSDNIPNTNAPFFKTGARLEGLGTFDWTAQPAYGILFDNTSIVSPGLNGPGTLTLKVAASQTVDLLGTLVMELGAPNVVGGALNDLLDVTGNLNLTGSTLNLSQSTGGSFIAGTYRLINYSGTLTGSFGTFTGCPAGYVCTVDTATPNQVNLVVTLISGTYWDGDAGPFNNGVVNGGNGTWDNVNSRWTDSTGTTNGVWDAGQIAHFAGTVGTVTISGTQDISGLDFSTSGYTLTGGSLNGVAVTNTITTPIGWVSTTLDTALIGTGGFTFLNNGIYKLTQDANYSGATQIRADNSGYTDLQLGNGGNNGMLLGTSGVTGVFSGTGGFTWPSVYFNFSTPKVANFPMHGLLYVGTTGTTQVTLNATSDFYGDVYLWGSSQILANVNDALGNGAYLDLYGTTKVTLAAATTQHIAGCVWVYDNATLVLNSGSQIIQNATPHPLVAASCGSEFKVAAGAKLIGSGTIDFSATTDALNFSVAGQLIPGNGEVANTVGAINLNAGAGRTVNMAGTLAMDLGAPNVVGGALNDLVDVTGNLVLTGSTLNLSQSTGGNFVAGTYRLINYSGTLVGSFGTVTGCPAGFTCTVSTATPNQVNLVVVVETPALTKAFLPTVINAGGISTLTFTLTNIAGSPAQSGLAFTDTLPSGLRVAAIPNASTTCTGGTVTAAASGSTIALANGAMAAGTAICTVTVDVTTAVTPTYSTVANCTAAITPQNTNGASAISGLSANLVNGVTDQCLAVLAPQTWWDGNAGPFDNGVINGGNGTWDSVNTRWTNNAGTANGVWDAGQIAHFAGTAGTVTIAGTQDISGLDFVTITGYKLTGGSLNGVAAINTITSPSTGWVDVTLDTALVGTGGFSFVNSGSFLLTQDATYTGATTIQADATSWTLLSLGNGGASGMLLGTSSLTGVTTDPWDDMWPTLGFDFSTAKTVNFPMHGVFWVSVAGATQLTLNATSDYYGLINTMGTSQVLANVNDALGSEAYLFLHHNSKVTLVAATTQHIGCINLADTTTLVLNTGSQIIQNAPRPSVAARCAGNDFTVAAGAKLVGAGTIDYSATPSALNFAWAAGGQLIPGNGEVANSVGAINLNVGAAGTVNMGGTLVMDLGAPNVVGGALNDLLDVTGNLVLTGSTLNLSQSTGGNFVAGTYRLINYTGTLTGTFGTVAGCPVGFACSVSTATANQVNLVVVSPTLTKAFVPTQIAVGGTSTLTFTLTNVAGSPAQSGLAFTDTLPAGLRVAAIPNASTTCTGGTVTAAASGSTIALASGGMAAGTASCTVTVDVTTAVTPTYSTVANCTAALTPQNTNGASAISGMSANLSNGVTDQCLAVRAPQTWWDGDAGPFDNSVVNGGNGTWDGTNINWTDSTGAINGTWAAGQMAQFAGTAGTVAVAGTQSVGGLSFLTDGYVINSGTLSFPGPGTFTLNAEPGVTATVNSNITGASSSLNKTGAGTVMLGSASTYLDQAWHITAGRLVGLPNTTLGGWGGTFVANGATLELRNSTVSGAGLGISGNGDDGVSGALYVPSGFTGTTLSGAHGVNSDSLIKVDSGGDLTLAGWFINSDFMLTLNVLGTGANEGWLSFRGNYQGTGGLTKIGTGRVLVRENMYYTGHTYVNEGYLQIGLGSLGNIMQSSGVTVAAGAYLQFHRSNALTFDRLVDGAGNVIKTNTGDTTLTANNTWGGTTTVTTGQLYINGTQSGNGLMTVQTGTTIGGSGTYGGAAVVQSGGTLSAGAAANTAGTFTFAGDLTLDAGSNSAFTLATTVTPDPSNDLVNVQGNLTLGGTLTVSAGTGFGVGTYRLFNYTGTQSGSYSSISLPAGYAGSVDVSVPNQVNLIVVAASSLTWWDGDAGPFNNNVVNGGNGTWDNTNTRWTTSTGSVNGLWPAGEIANFAGTAGTVTISGTQDISGLNFVTDFYTLTGGSLNGVAATNTITTPAGWLNSVTLDTALIGTGGFSFLNNGVYSITQDATYTGATTMQADAGAWTDLSLGNGGAGGMLLGTSSLTGVTTDPLDSIWPILYFDFSTAKTVNFPMHGVLWVNVIGATQLTLNATSDYYGHIKISGTSQALANVNDALGSEAALTLRNNSKTTLAAATTQHVGCLNVIDTAMLVLNTGSQIIQNAPRPSVASFCGGNDFTVAAGAKLVGAGTIDYSGTPSALNFAWAAGAQLIPGNGEVANSVGTINLNVGAAATVTMDGTLVMDLAAPAASDRLNVTGNLNLGAASALNFSTQAGYNSAAEYVLVTYTGIRTGTFATDNLAAIGYQGIIVYDDANKRILLRALPSVTLSKISNGGTGTFNFNMYGLSVGNVSLTTTVAGTPVSSAVYLGAIGVAVGITETSPSGWSANPASVSCIDANGATNGNGVASLGVTSGNQHTIPAANMVAGANITCTFTNEQNSLSGVVFNDGGAPVAGVNSGTPNDGLQNGSEAGLSGVTVSLTNCGATTYSTATTDGSGAYTLSIPSAQIGSTVCVTTTVPTTYLATGANASGTVTPDAVPTTVGGIVYTYTRASQQTSFTAPANGALILNFGQVPVSVLMSNNTGTVAQGSNVTYQHSFTAGTGGSLTLGTTATASPLLSGWTDVLYPDPGCSGTVQTGQSPIAAPITVTQGQQYCFVLRQFAPAVVSNGSSNTVLLNAALVFTHAAPSLSASYQVTDLTSISSGAVEIKKAVRNVTLGEAFNAGNQAKSGDILEYRITYTNLSAAPINTLVIGDVVPTFTTFISASAGALPNALSSCTKKTPANPTTPVPCNTVEPTGGTGPVNWQFGGVLNPGASGEVTFMLLVD